MDVILKQSGNNVGLYIDNKLTTVFGNKNIKQVTDWVGKNLKSVKIYIAN